MAAIDLNSDLGESYGAWRMGDDEAMLAIVSSANIACGFHAGDPAGIYRTVKAAAEKLLGKRTQILIGGNIGKNKNTSI